MQEEDLRLVQGDNCPFVQEHICLVEEGNLFLVREEDLLLVQEEDLLLVQEEGSLPLSILGQSGKSSQIFPSSSNATHGEVLPAQFRFSSRLVGGGTMG